MVTNNKMANYLSDSEKREVLNLIADGKPLPDSYRFRLFGETKKVDLLWEGKSYEPDYIPLPFQIIEHVDEPRTEKTVKSTVSFDFASGRQSSGWTNKLIWGDNKYILSSLLNGPMNEDIKSEGGVKLIYIDPPFSVGTDYTITVKIGNNEEYEKKPSILENFAYKNTWNKKGNSFLQMIYERIYLMRDLLEEDGVLVLRIDHHWGHYVKVILDEVFGKDNFRNEIFVNRTKKNTQKKTKQKKLTTSVESLFVYSKSQQFDYFDTTFDLQHTREGYWRVADDSAGESSKPERILDGKTFYPPKGKHFKFSQENLEQRYKDGTVRINSKTGRIQYFVEATNSGQLDTNWTDIPGYSFSTGYPTENHEKLLDRVIRAFSKEDDLVCDFFSGSGTTAAVCEKLHRKWIVSDIGKFSIHTTKKRLIQTQRQLKKCENNWRAFELLNIGKYQREYYLKSEIEEKNLFAKEFSAKREKEFEDLILRAYFASRVDEFISIQGKKADTYVSIGPIDRQVSRLHVEQIIDECLRHKILSIDILAFEYEMGLFPTIQDEARKKGIRISYKKIPMEVFDSRAVDSGAVIFHDVSYIEFKTHVNDRNEISVELTDFAVFYNADNIFFEEKLKGRKSTVIVDNGVIIEKKIDDNGNIYENILTNRWHDWIDYWSVDFDYESKPEIIRVTTDDKKFVDVPTGNYIFENEWQSFRHKKSKDNLELTSSLHKIRNDDSTMMIAVKVVDILGNDTIKATKVKIK